MDPYVERPQIWPDFHDAMVYSIRGLLQPLLKPKYVAIGQERVYVAESKRLVRPDVAVIRSKARRGQGGVAVAEVSADPAKVFVMVRDEVREPYLHIVDPSDPARVVTAIEILSPKNKRAGPGRKSYVQKREELWRSGSNFVEIDLLRAGRPTTGLDGASLGELEPFDYLTVVSRQKPRQREAYATSVRQRLPRVSIPLRKNDRDVTLDLQAAFTRSWDEGPYLNLLQYDEPPPGPMSDEDTEWCAAQLRAKLPR
jgi:hypothetical protein